MKDNMLTETIAELTTVIKGYMEAKLDLWKIRFLEKVTKISTYLFTFIAVLIGFMFFLLLLAFSFSFWYGDNIGSLSEGFLISAVSFAVITVLIFILRKRLFSNNIVKNIAPIIFSEEE